MPPVTVSPTVYVPLMLPIPMSNLGTTVNSRLFSSIIPATDLIKTLSPSEKL